MPNQYSFDKIPDGVVIQKDAIEPIDPDNSYPLTFTNPNTNEKVTVGTAKFVETDKGIVILATVGHSQFERLLEEHEISGLSISTKINRGEDGKSYTVVDDIVPVLKDGR